VKAGVEDPFDPTAASYVDTRRRHPDAALARLAMHARIVICGANSQYKRHDGP